MNGKPEYSLYSAKAVTLGTLLGGPLAAGLLLKRNFVNLGQKSMGQRALWLSVLFLVAMCALLALLPESVAEAVPNSVVPAVYTTLVYQLMQFYQGEALKAHERVDGPWYSGWKAFGVGLGSLLATLLVWIGTLITMDPGMLSYDSYNEKVGRFNQQETRALKLYPLMEGEGSSDEEVARFLEQTGIPAWEECRRVLDEIDQEKYLDDELVEQNQKMKKYISLRLESYRIMLALARKQGDPEELNRQLKDLSRRLEPYLE